ncbi:MAG: cysteine desulfurase family protein [Gemmatimonas sp.]|jgi:cysteine desulfurase|uniref:cysteine desulfurase family protein n=1 Tax=Gemmatimonas sp. TaxID=1962908 RepID=UPI0022CCC4F9|nr:cysteine desulfurase family protein [Gemmatimonas sp.]MCA2994826.1 cysteine desulfurase [Gemmatimonas sp.]MCE2955186.1 cysteine desulfurase [Gemmatimonas sp.]MCZ8012592.1 cysteine desulfurase family protein [Gemmatimonas sp.]MCZ8268433.1 cysteine desulfurase family protein [Gemmatimonas sp.]
MPHSPIYLDHAATTPVRDEVMAAMVPFFGPRFGNPSSVHRWGREARVALDEARERMAACLGANPDEVCFTSGGTEGDNFAVLGVYRTLKAQGRTAAVSTPIEHKAVLAAVHQVVHEGGEERLVRVHGSGLVDAEHFATLLDERVAVASVMWVNNEVGVVQDIPALAAQAKSVGAVFHTDGVQAFGKVAIDARTQAFDLLTLSGHKIGAPKGIGALFIRRDTPLEPMFHGGSQDRGRRPGTENVAFAIGLATAAELVLAEHDAEQARLLALRTALETGLRERIPDVVIHGVDAPRAAHVVNVSIPGANSESLLMALDLRGIACSAGSACQSGSVSASHVLSAMGVAPELANAALRLSLGCLSTPECVTRTVDVLATLADKARGVKNAPVFETVEF